MQKDTTLLKGLSMSPSTEKDLGTFLTLLQTGVACTIEIRQCFSEAGKLSESLSKG